MAHSLKEVTAAKEEHQHLVRELEQAMQGCQAEHAKHLAQAQEQHHHALGGTGAVFPSAGASSLDAGFECDCAVDFVSGVSF